MQSEEVCGRGPVDEDHNGDGVPHAGLPAGAAV